MTSSNISNLLSDYLSNPVAFRMEDLLDDIEDLIAKCEFPERLLKDTRFIRIKGKSSDEDLFLPERTLFLWFSRLTLRHARVSCDKPTITRTQYLNLVNSLRSDDGWEKIPSEILSLGEHYGFITGTTKEEVYLLPLSNVLGSLPVNKYTEFLFSSVEQMLNSLASTSPEKRKDYIETSPEKWLQDAIKSLEIRHNRTILMVMRKEGIISGEKETLESIAQDYNVTRERVRQVIGTFWERFSHAPGTRKILLQGIVSYVIKTHGSLLVGENTKVIHFLAKACEIPLVLVAGTNLLIIGRVGKTVDQFEAISQKDDIEFDKAKLTSTITNIIPLPKDDTKLLTNCIFDNRRKRIKKNECTLIALRTIGKPAHYSEVYQKLGSLFPELDFTEHAVHACLDRLADNDNVVWIGIKGTYALREWGYERPENSIFDTIAKIVCDDYKKTGQPVSLEKIYTEIGKYRRVINKVSLDIAITRNEHIKKVSRNYYIPFSQEPEKQSEWDDADEIIHERLSDFRNERSNPDNGNE
jgi:hypothetical protein